MSEETQDIHHMSVDIPYFDRVAESYPGLQTWCDIQRSDSSGVIVHVFDRRISELNPIYVFGLANIVLEYMLSTQPKDEGRITPGFNWSEFVKVEETGELPPGFRPPWAPEKVTP